MPAEDPTADAVEPAAGDPAQELVFEPEPTLPEAVRQRVINLAASAITGLPIDELPTALRRVAKFAPNRRARLGGPIIATQLAADPLLRQRLAARVVKEAGDLGAAIAEGAPPSAADPVEVAALAYLCRPDGWRDMVDGATLALRADSASAAVEGRVREVEQRLARTEHDRAMARVEAEKLRDELARLRDETSGLREEARTLARTLREVQVRERKATEMLATEKGRAVRAAADHDSTVRRLKSKLAEAESQAGAARQTAKDARAVDDARLWLLLETIGRAAVGLRRELALEPTDRLPADFVADAHAELPGGPCGLTAARALDTDDPTRLDQLLALPKAHLVVDGYNVTKRGFADISLDPTGLLARSQRKPENNASRSAWARFADRRGLLMALCHREACRPTTSLATQDRCATSPDSRPQHRISSDLRRFLPLSCREPASWRPAERRPP